MKIELKHSDFVALLSEGRNGEIESVSILWDGDSMPGQDLIGSLFLHGDEMMRLREYADCENGFLTMPSVQHLETHFRDVFHAEGYALEVDALMAHRNLALEYKDCVLRHQGDGRWQLFFNVRVLTGEWDNRLVIKINPEFFPVRGKHEFS